MNIPIQDGKYYIVFTGETKEYAVQVRDPFTTYKHAVAWAMPVRKPFNVYRAFGTGHLPKKVTNVIQVDFVQKRRIA